MKERVLHHGHPSLVQVLQDEGAPLGELNTLIVKVEHEKIISDKFSAVKYGAIVVSHDISVAVSLENDLLVGTAMDRVGAAMVAEDVLESVAADPVRHSLL